MKYPKHKLNISHFSLRNDLLNCHIVIHTSKKHLKFSLFVTGHAVNEVEVPYDFTQTSDDYICIFTK